MANLELPPETAAARLAVPWRGIASMACLIALAGLVPSLDITHKFGPEWDVARIVLVGLAVGTGIGALRSQVRVDRILGAATVPVGGLVVARFAAECLGKLGWI